MKNVTISVGSVCSGIEAASVAWKNLNFNFKWFSEISAFPSKLLNLKYPTVPNLGDMCDIPQKLAMGAIDTPDLICGGTPCQAFSLAGWKKGLEDKRGNLTLKFVDIVNRNDEIRKKNGLSPSLVLWENVEGVLKDKTNAFGCFIASLAGCDTEIKLSRWPQAGIVRGPKRNIAWRILNAKYFGLPQQRRRLYVIAGGKDFAPENILFEKHLNQNNIEYNNAPSFTKDNHAISLFRGYTDCLYSAYGTKWNGNAAAYNGSLYVLQNKRLRRFTPLECERLMGFPDNYTDIPKAKPTNRYQSLGNSWAVPVIKWLGNRIINQNLFSVNIDETQFSLLSRQIKFDKNCIFFDFSNSPISINSETSLNCSEKPEDSILGNIYDVIDVNADVNFYITPVGCKGILRRKEERKLTINPNLESVLKSISSTWSEEKIEKISRVQPRGRFSTAIDQQKKELELTF